MRKEDWQERGEMGRTTLDQALGNWVLKVPTQQLGSRHCQETSTRKLLENELMQGNCISDSKVDVSSEVDWQWEVPLIRMLRVVNDRKLNSNDFRQQEELG